ncbi:MAG TPA: peptidylprolyl isomerase [Acidimicrobiales bacterium]|nr:peptidylprolyl isomerase [Acidimicrobiales bacterium]
MGRLVVLVAALAALALSACGSFTTYAAEVNGERISQADLRRELNAILDNTKYLDRVDQNFSAGSGGQDKVRGEGAGTFNSVFVAAVLDRRIGFALIHQEVERRKLKVPTATLDATRNDLEQNYGKDIFRAFPKSYREDLVRIFAEQTVLKDALGGGAIDDETVQQFYEANKEAFNQTCVRHILVATEAEAAAVKARLDAGEDFAAVAKETSTDNQGDQGGSAANGGDLGCVGAGAVVPEFEQAMNALQVGQISGPVKTDFGYHIISVTDRKTLSLEEAAPQIRANLERQRPDPLQSYVTTALEKATIKVNPRYGRFVKSPTPGVRAPKLLDASSSTSVPELPAPPDSETPPSSTP